MSELDVPSRLELSRTRSAISRRSVLRGTVGGVAALGAAALIGCGGDEEDEPAAPAAGGQATGTPAARGEQPTEDYVALHRQDGAPPELPYNYSEPEKQPRPGGIFRIASGLSFFARTFDMNEAGAVNVGGLLTADRLIGWRAGPRMSKYRIDLEPQLARSWEMSPDGLTFTFRLQPNVKYHNVPPVNGRALRAEDIRLSLERAAKQGQNTTLLEAMDQPTAVDDQTLRVTMKRPDPDFLIPLGSGSLPIFPPELYDQNLLTRTAIGTGPAILEEVEAARILRVRSNPDYWQGKPLIDGLEFRNVPDVAARVASFRAGQIETGNTLASTISEVRALKASAPDAQIVGSPILNGVYQYIPNAAHPKFRDARVRQALSLAINRERHVQLTFGGFGKMLPGLPWTFVFDRTPTSSEMGPWYKFDPTQAKQLLAAAGAENLEFELKHNAISAGPSNPDAQHSAMLEFFRDIGVTMRLTNLETQTWLLFYNGRRFVTEPGEAMYGYVTGAPTTNGFYYGAIHSKSPGNLTGVNDPQIDALAERQRVELNPTARKQVLRQIWDRMLSEVYHINAASTYFVSALQPSVRWWRFEGPLLSIRVPNGFGYGYHRGWLDK